MSIRHMSQMLQVLLFITEHGPVTTYEIVKFGVDSGFSGADNHKRNLVKIGLVEREEISKMYSNYGGREQFVYIASKLWKGTIK